MQLVDFELDVVLSTEILTNFAFYKGICVDRRSSKNRYIRVLAPTKSVWRNLFIMSSSHANNRGYYEVVPL